jgi:hypothetical protein
MKITCITTYDLVETTRDDLLEEYRKGDYSLQFVDKESLNPFKPEYVKNCPCWLSNQRSNKKFWKIVNETYSQKKELI